MTNSIDGSIDEFYSTRNAVSQYFFPLLHTQTYPNQFSEQHNFSSEQLLIRPLEYRDSALYEELFTDQEITQYTGGIYSTKQVKVNFINSLKALKKQPIQYLTWVIETKYSQKSIGIATLIWPTEQSRCAEFGIMLNRNNHNQGYCCELVARLIQHCFAQYQLTSLYSFTLLNNHIAQHILKKFSFLQSERGILPPPSNQGIYWKLTRDNLPEFKD
jgi:RimJ/RimL family protein N-acetyltransferase